MRILLSAFTLLFLLSCSNEESTSDKKLLSSDNQKEEIQSDTNLTSEEIFSSSVMSDFLSESEDDALADYLETELYRIASGFSGCSLVEISPSIWLVMFEKDNQTKNFILQKYIDIKTNDYYFRIKETGLTAEDVIGKTK
jgi:hypothetical protein